MNDVTPHQPLLQAIARTYAIFYIISQFSCIIYVGFLYNVQDYCPGFPSNHRGLLESCKTFITKYPSQDSWKNQIYSAGFSSQEYSKNPQGFFTCQAIPKTSVDHYREGNVVIVIIEVEPVKSRCSGLDLHLLDIVFVKMEWVRISYVLWV